MKDISIIIVSWKVKEQVRKCLASLPLAFGSLSGDVWLVDNASGDGTVEMARTEFPSVKVIANADNYGFSKAVNLAWRQADSRFVLLLNPDIITSPHCLEKAIRFLEKYPKIGVLGCKLENTDGSIQPSVRRLPSLCDQLVVLSKFHNLFPWLIKRYAMLDFNYKQSAPVESVMGAWFLVRRELYEKIGYLDNGYFIWFEEVDYCKRALDAGYTVWYEASVRSVHERGASFGQVKPLQKQLWLNNSMRRYFWKHKPKWQWLLICIMAIVSLLPAAVVQWFNWKNTYAVFRKAS
ncbi:MAG: glycosyltransferase family 2 protein [bacterium]